MHPLTCYDGQISLCHAKIEKISNKIFVMIKKDGGGETIFGFYGGNTELMGGPPTRENPDVPYNLPAKICYISPHHQYSNIFMKYK